MQETDFPFELVIGEDCSTDGTREIVFDYRDKYPDRIKVVTSDQNVGAIENAKRTILACKSKYFASCEGDDFWSDPHKPQKQVDFLEANPHYGLVHGDVNHLYQENVKTIEAYNKTNKIKIPEGDIFEDLMVPSHIVKTFTTLCRKELIDKHFDFRVADERGWRLFDLPLWLEISRHSKVHYMDEVLATYRLLGESASRSKNYLSLYHFHQSVWDVRLYYLEKYACSESTGNIIYKKYFSSLIKDGYAISDRKISRKGMRGILRMRTIPGIKVWVMFLLTQLRLK
jgi:glycosyltransferase involved in cell wall biosynthesis